MQTKTPGSQADSSAVAHPERELLVVCLIGLLAFGVAYGHHVYFQRAKVPLRPTVDEKADLERAEQILAGTWPDRPFYQAPLYPFFLAGVQKLLGPNPDTPRILQFAFLAATAMMTFWLARSLHGLGAGVIAGLLVALCKPLIFFSRLHLKSALALLLVTGCLTLYVDGRRRGCLPRLVGAGLLLGLSCLTRGNLLVLIPVLGLWLLLLPVDRQRKVVLAGCFVIAAALPIAPATWHNYRAGSLVLTTWQGGSVFYTGNHSGNRKGGYALPPFLRPGPRTETEGTGWLQAAERLSGTREMTCREASGYWFRTGLAELVDQPGRWAGLWLRKLLLFWNAYEMPANVDLQFMRRLDPMLRWPLPDFGWLALLGPAALWMLWRTPGARPLAVYVLIGWMVMTCFFVLGRYRLTMIPPLAIGAGIFCSEAAAWLVARDLRHLAAGAVLLLVGGLLAFRPVDQIHQGDSWFALGVAYEQDGELDRAAEAYAKAIADNPTDAMAPTRLGSLRHRQGRLREAEQLLIRAVKLDTEAADALNGLGAVYYDLGQYDKAEVHLRAAERLLPDRPEIQRNLAILYRRLGRFLASEHYARTTIKLLFFDIRAQEILAYSLAKQGKLREAADAYRTLRAQSKNRDLEACVREAMCRKVLGQTDKVAELERLIRRNFPKRLADKAIAEIEESK